jgi:hypothetical protein
MARLDIRHQRRNACEGGRSPRCAAHAEEFLQIVRDRQGIADEASMNPRLFPIVRKELKKRQDSVEAFEKGGRQDLADKEKAEGGDSFGLLAAGVDPG